MRTGKQHRRGVTGMVLSLSLLAAVAFFCPPRAQAVGIGPYVDIAGGSGKMEWDNGTGEFDVDVGTAAAGLAIDTSPTMESNFNYRLNIGLEGQSLEDDTDVSLDMGGLVVENIFGFAMVRRPNMRWWMGPLVRFGFYSGETDEFYDGGDRVKVDADLFEFGVGLVTGINLKVNRNLVLAPSAGVRFISASGDGTYTNYTGGYKIDNDLSGHFSTAFINFALLFQ